MAEAARGLADPYTRRLCFALVVRYIARQLSLDQALGGALGVEGNPPPPAEPDAPVIACRA